MKAVIMVGGFGKRLKPVTQVIPKPLLPLGDEEPILESTIRGLKKHNFNEIILCTNYKSYLFETYLGDGSSRGIKVTYSKEKKPLGTAGPLKLLENKLDEPFLVINGDILTNLNFEDFRKFHYSNKADMTIATKIVELPLRYGVVKTRNNKITNIEEKPIMKAEVMAGIYFLNPEIIKEIPKNEPYLMTTLIKKISNNKKLYRYQLNNCYWLDIGQMDDYEKTLNKDYKKILNAKNKK